jgi:hypothetical protein
MGKWTMEELKALTPRQRHHLFNNARSANSPEAKELVMLLENAGLPYSEGACLAMDDPITLKIGDLLNSEEGTKALIAATEAGLPAMAGIDRMLSQTLGVDYGGHNMSIATAGSLVAKRMRQLGYRNSEKKGRLPDVSVAKTAEIFVKASDR